MNLCMFGASSAEIGDSYIEAAYALGKEMAKRGYRLVYGGGATGLMGAAARGVHEAGGELTGVAPKFFDQEGVLYKAWGELVFTETMRQRKQKMEDMSQGFIVVPGGIGTYEEFFEILTLKQLGRHEKPIAIYNINGYYDSIRAMLEKTVDEGFMAEKCLKLCAWFDEVGPLLDYMENHG